MKPGRYDIVWSGVIEMGMTSVTLQIGYKLGLMMIDSKKWCEPCNKVCDRFGIGRIVAGPLGEMMLQPIDGASL